MFINRIRFIDIEIILRSYHPVNRNVRLVLGDHHWAELKKLTLISSV